MDRKTASELQVHMFGTYYSLRLGLAVIGVALPLALLLAGGLLHDVWFEGSISAYYHTGSQVDLFTTRDLFVGGLLAAGACLYLYKGFSDAENLALNLAGVFAVLVALLPTAATEADRGVVSMLHGTAAVLFFLCIAYVSLFRSRDTLRLLPEEQRARFARLYDAVGGAMIVSPLIAVVLSYTIKPGTLIFWVETLGIWAFAAYWFFKTVEMRRSQAEQRALEGELKREVGLESAATPEGGRSHLDRLLRRPPAGARGRPCIVPAGAADTVP
ncbi:MAG: hypothetical protein AAFN13_15510 [Bacteroidota bacterium]